MKTCPNCGAQMNDNAKFCISCGAPSPAAYEEANQAQYNYEQENAQQPVSPEGGYQQYDQGAQYNQYQQQYNQYQQAPPYVNPYDHTAEFDPEDISKNKIFCMLAYLSGLIGIIVALLVSSQNKSEYISFHVRQSLKFTILTTLTTLVIGVLSITIIIPIAGAIWLIILFVLKIIAFVQVCMGQAKEPAIVRAFPFFK